MLRYFAGLEHVLFSENQPRDTLLSFCLGINYNEFIMNDFGSRMTSVGQLQKYAARAKLFVC